MTRKKTTAQVSQSRGQNPNTRKKINTKQSKTLHVQVKVCRKREMHEMALLRRRRSAAARPRAIPAIILFKKREVTQPWHRGGKVRGIEKVRPWVPWFRYRQKAFFKLPLKRNHRRDNAHYDVKILFTVTQGDQPDRKRPDRDRQWDRVCAAASGFKQRSLKIT